MLRDSGGGGNISLKVEVVYVYPMLADYHAYAQTFVDSYLQNDPLIEHQLTVVCNGAQPNDKVKELFSKLPNVMFLVHDNSGYDIGAFQKASSKSLADMIVFFGATSYVKGKGWLLRMAQAFLKLGPAQYGAMGNRGTPQCNVFPHIRTTGFWTAPHLFNAYPAKITRPEQRFPFEHGPNCFTTWLTRRGVSSWVVTHSAEYAWEQWDCPNGFHNGTQSDLLCGDRVTKPPHYHTP